MTTPKEKAEQILKRHLHHVSGVPEHLILIFHKGDTHVETARQCAIYMADEILFQYTTLNSELVNGIYRNEKVVFWQHVKNEIAHL